MKILGIIPARYASTRFPGKPLVEIEGKTMIRRVWEQAAKCKFLSEVYVATDDERIEEEILNTGGNVIMTSSQHPTGTDRCREALDLIEAQFGRTYTAVINIQGDEPFIEPTQIDLLASAFETESTQIATLVKKVEQQEDIFNPSIIKVTKNNLGEALYFSRAAIPFLRGVELDEWFDKSVFWKHIGIYSYRTYVLRQITELTPSYLEKAESLEQLRWLENGYKIKVMETQSESISIDTPEDLKRII